MRDESNTYQEAGIGTAKLKALIELFPIGRELRYSPDSQLAVVFDTIIVAYRVNDHFIYSRNEIVTDSNGYPSAIALGEKEAGLPVDQIQRFHLLVPDTSDMEGTLDYDRRAIIGRSQQFLKDHVITLMANAGASGGSSLITRVVEQITMQDGPYTNSKMVLLNPEFDTFSVADQLHKSRGKTHVPVDLYYRKDEPPYPCVLNDFSESSVGLRAIDNQQAMPPMAQDDAVTIVIDLGAAKTYTIKGRILRRTSDSCVVRLEELFKDHKFSSFSLLDSLELKTGLLNYGN